VETESRFVNCDTARRKGRQQLRQTHHATVYFISQGASILYPGTAFFDPQFVTPNSFPLGIALQVYIEAGYLALTALAALLALRSGAHWVGWQPAGSTA
jgi:hypothetical protein